MNWILFGFKGCGKSTFSKLAAKRFSLPRFDTDEWIEKEAGLPVKEIVQTQGMGVFHSLERQAAQRAARLKGHLIATGGTTLLDEKNAQLLRAAGPFIYLKASEEILRERWRQRPLIHEPDFEKVYFSRLALYEKMADHVIIPENNKALEKLWEIIHSDAFFRSSPGVNRTGGQ